MNISYDLTDFRHNMNIKFTNAFSKSKFELFAALASDDHENQFTRLD